MRPDLRPRAGAMPERWTPEVAPETDDEDWTLLSFAQSWKFTEPSFGTTILLFVRSMSFVPVEPDERISWPFTAPPEATATIVRTALSDERPAVELASTATRSSSIASNWAEA